MGAKKSLYGFQAKLARREASGDKGIFYKQSIVYIAACGDSGNTDIRFALSVAVLDS